jgi:hypothetical protein
MHNHILLSIVMESMIWHSESEGQDVIMIIGTQVVDVLF